MIVSVFYWMINYCYLFILFNYWILLRIFKNGNSDSVTCLVGKTAIVTGGNSGIGYAISTLLASRGCRVIIADKDNAEKSRDTIIERTKNKNITSMHLNLASLESIRKFAKEIREQEGKIDILVNNAGVGTTSENCTNDGLNAVMQINFFGPFLLTHLLIEPLKKAGAARIVFTGSSMGYASLLTLENLDQDLNPLHFKLDKYIAGKLYQNSKMCNILAAQEFGKKLQKYGFIVNSSDPGLVGTKLVEAGEQHYTGFDGAFIRVGKCILMILCSVDELIGAQTSFHLASSEKLEGKTGGHYYICEKFPKPAILKNQKLCDNIWSKTEELVQLRPEERI